VTGDADDNVFLECADVACADYLVTGNLRHFPRFWKTTWVITPREFIGLVASSSEVNARRARIFGVNNPHDKVNRDALAQKRQPLTVLVETVLSG
jgi:hypothetical protein